MLEYASNIVKYILQIRKIILPNPEILFLHHVLQSTRRKLPFFPFETDYLVISHLQVSLMRKGWGSWACSASRRDDWCLNVYQCLRGRCQDYRARLFLVMLSNRTRGRGRKLMHRKFHLNFFTLQGTQHWNRLLREVMEAPWREIFLSGHNTVPCALGAWAGRSDQVDPLLSFPILPIHSGILWFCERKQ